MSWPPCCFNHSGFSRERANGVCVGGGCVRGLAHLVPEAGKLPRRTPVSWEAREDSSAAQFKKPEASEPEKPIRSPCLKPILSKSPWRAGVSPRVQRPKPLESEVHQEQHKCILLLKTVQREGSPSRPPADCTVPTHFKGGSSPLGPTCKPSLESPSQTRPETVLHLGILQPRQVDTEN